MKVSTQELWLEVPERRAIVSLHSEVERMVEESGVQEGLVLVSAMHITASVFINDNETGLHHDYELWLESLAPFDASPQRYHHNRTGEDNADAHMKRQIMGREVVLATDGYPILRGDLQSSEDALKELLTEDPLLHRRYRSTKAPVGPDGSFDDRCYVRLRLEAKA